MPLIAAATLLTLLFIFLFFRENRRARLATQRREDEGNLHILLETKKFLQEKGADTAFLEKSIKELSVKIG